MAAQMMPALTVSYADRKRLPSFPDLRMKKAAIHDAIIPPRPNDACKDLSHDVQSKRLLGKQRRNAKKNKAAAVEIIADIRLPKKNSPPNRMINVPLLPVRTTEIRTRAAKSGQVSDERMMA